MGTIRARPTGRQQQETREPNREPETEPAERTKRSAYSTFGSQPFVCENTGKMLSSGGGRGERKKKSRLFLSKNLGKLAKISKIEVLIMAWSFLQSFSSIGANLTHFVKHFTFFSTFVHPKVPIYWTCFNIIINFWKNQALGPLKNERSQNSASKSLLNSSRDLNATLFMSVQSFKFHFFLFFFFNVSCFSTNLCSRPPWPS